MANTQNRCSAVRSGSRDRDRSVGDDHREPADILIEKQSLHARISGTLYEVRLQTQTLRALHRAAIDAGRRGVTVPSRDLDAVAAQVGGRIAAGQALARLVRSGQVVRVRRDLLVLPEPTGLIDVEITDLIDAVAPQPYLITGGAALSHLDLTDQHYFTLTVLVPSMVSSLEFRGQTARFFKTDPTNIWGAEPEMVPAYARPERALLDVLSHPRFGVSLNQAADALIRAYKTDPGFLQRLFDATARYGAGAKGHGSRSSARRVGLVIDRLLGHDAAEPFRELIGANRSPVLLRVGGTPGGPVDRTWRVVVNATLDPEQT